MTATWRIIVVVLGAGLIIEALFLVALMRQVGSLLLRVGPAQEVAVVSGPEVGDVKPLPGHEGAHRPSLVLFTSSGCPQCKSLEPALRRIHADYGPEAPSGHQLDVVAVVTDQKGAGRAEYAQKLGSFARTDLIALMQDWNIPGTPFAVALGDDSRVRGAEVVNTPDQLETLAVNGLGLRLVPVSREAADHRMSLQIAQIGKNGADSTEVLT